MERYTTELEDTGLDEFEVQFVKLLRVCEQLKMENFALRTQQAELVELNTDLVDKNELARSKVSAILTKLKQPEMEV